MKNSKVHCTNRNLTESELKQLMKDSDTIVKFVSAHEIRDKGVEAILEEIKKDHEDLSEEDLLELKTELEHIVENQDKIDKKVDELKAIEAEITECNRMLAVYKKVHEAVKKIKIWRRTSIILRFITLLFIALIMGLMVFGELKFTIPSLIFYIVYLVFMNFLSKYTLKKGVREYTMLDNWLEEYHPDVRDELLGKMEGHKS